MLGTESTEADESMLQLHTGGGELVYKEATYTCTRTSYVQPVGHRLCVDVSYKVGVVMMHSYTTNRQTGRQTDRLE